MISFEFSPEQEDFRAELRRFARRLTGANDQADDLLQDCIERALSRADLFEPGTNLRAWLFTIMRNIAITRARRDVLRDRHARMTLAQSAKVEAPRQEAVIALKVYVRMICVKPCAVPSSRITSGRPTTARISSTTWETMTAGSPPVGASALSEGTF